MSTQPPRKSLSVLCVTYNVGLAPLAEPLEPLFRAQKSPDLVSVSAQEFCAFADMFLDLNKTERIETWLRAVSVGLAELGQYRCAGVKTLGGVLLALFAREGLHVDVVAEDAVALGTLWLPNKAAVAMRVSIENTATVAFVAAHLDAHPGGRHLRKRNAQVLDVWGRIAFGEERMEANEAEGAPLLGSKEGTTIWDCDAVFLSGDLNYRLTLPRTEVLRSIENDEFAELAGRDELAAAKRDSSHGLHAFFEHPIAFRPTYKYKGPTEFSKLRTPSYTDRILFTFHYGSEEADTVRRWYVDENSIPGSPIQARTYASHMNYINSDHKPVTAEFALDLEALASRPHIFRAEVDPWRQWKAFVGLKLLAPPIGLVLHVPDRPWIALAVLSVGCLIYMAMHW